MGTAVDMSATGPTNTRVLILAADDFEDMELLYPLYRLRRSRSRSPSPASTDEPVTGKKGHGPVEPMRLPPTCSADGFDALVIPGGYAPDKLRRDDHVLDLVRTFDRDAKPIAFICHAGWVPISAGILKGRRATSVDAIRDDMVNAGVDWVDEATRGRRQPHQRPHPCRPRALDAGAPRGLARRLRPACQRSLINPAAGS